MPRHGKSRAREMTERNFRFQVVDLFCCGMGDTPGSTRDGIVRMRSMVALFIRSPGFAWLSVLALSVLGGMLAGWTAISLRHEEYLSRLVIEAERRGLEVSSQTLNGNIMGALS